MIPVIVEKHETEKVLPLILNSKYLVPQDVSTSVFVNVIKNRMLLGSEQSFHLFVNEKNLSKMKIKLKDMYGEEKDEDGFLYMVYASRETIK